MAFKNYIRTQTGAFLAKIPNNNSSFGFNDQQDYYTGAINARGPNNQKSLTGAGEALLPMQIVTAVPTNVGGQETLERIVFTLLINPDNWNHGKTNTVQNAFTRKGWVQQLWGPNQDTISSSGKTAAFMNPSVGLDSFTSQTSFAYLNFMALVSAYRNNGYIFHDYTAFNELTRVIKTIQGVQIMYDNEIHMGHFSNFTIDEVEETPYIQNYNFEFIISSLTGSDADIRGHYKSIPQNSGQLDLGTTVDPNTLIFVADPFIKKPSSKIVNTITSKPFIQPTTNEDVTTSRLWERKTGRPWSDAFKYGFTNGSSTDNNKLLKLLLNNSAEITKVFATYKLTVNSEGSGTVSPAGESTVTYGYTTRLSASPAAGFRFVKWSSSNKSAKIGAPASPNTTVTLTENTTVTANFTVKI